MLSPKFEDLLARIRSFDHPEVDSKQTEVVSEAGTDGSFSVAVKLFDHQRNYLVRDYPLGKGYTLPGMLVTFKPGSAEVRIENAYLRSEYSGRGIGTKFICDLLEAARSNGFKKVSLVADEATEAASYWERKQGFVVPDPELPRLMIKNI